MRVLDFLPEALSLASKSKDPKNQVGAIALDEDFNILSGGFNGFPRGVEDLPERMRVRSVKLKYMAHAEENLVAQAARVGARLKGASILVTSLFPCCTCARLLIQAGVKEIYAPKMDGEANAQWHEEEVISTIMFEEAGVKVINYEY